MKVADPLHGVALADRLFEEFGSIGAILAANAHVHRRILGTRVQALNFLGLLREAFLAALRAEALDRPIIKTSLALMDYLRSLLAHETAERFYILYLDSSSRLIREEVASYGSVTQAPVFPREILRRALELGASSLILVHNHPSGDPTPSGSDIEITKHIDRACRLCQIAVLDHVVVARSGTSSMRAFGLL